MPKKGRPADPSRALIVRGSEPDDRQSALIQRVFESIPRDELIAALIDSGDDKAVQIAERLSDAQFSRANLAKHCASVGMQPRDVWKILIESRKLEARLKVSEALPSIAAAITEAAIPRIAPCPHCAGGASTSKFEGGLCPMCLGVNQIAVPPDREAQKMALEMGEVLGQKAPLFAQQFNNFNDKGGGGGGGWVAPPDMTDWSRSSDAIFEDRVGSKQSSTEGAVDAEIVE